MSYKNKGNGRGKEKHVAHQEANWTVKVGVVPRAAPGSLCKGHCARVTLSVILSSATILTAATIGLSALSTQIHCHILH